MFILNCVRIYFRVRALTIFIITVLPHLGIVKMYKNYVMPESQRQEGLNKYK